MGLISTLDFSLLPPLLLMVAMVLAVVALWVVVAAGLKASVAIR
jgi:hypothetical protein